MSEDVNVMVDLETFGTGNDAVILSIGATKFSRTEILDKFHVGVDPVSCQALGLKIDAPTVLWWMKDELGAAREALLGLERVDLPSALQGFTQWFGTDELPIWGNGSTFDNVILRSAYAACRVDYPTSFRHDMCFRTLRRLAPGVQVERVGTHHDALDDAIYQTNLWQAIMNHLEGLTVPRHLAEARQMLGRHAKQFRLYQANHEAKAGDLTREIGFRSESQAKAADNQRFAEEAEQLFARLALN